MSDLLTLAEGIAQRTHLGQKEESTGDDYILHVKRVVDLVDGEEAKIVAWLHDVVEDSPVTLDDLRGWGFSNRIVDAVEMLTRKPTETYANYIADIQRSGYPLAVQVKIADLKDHLRPNCPASLRPRYEQALMVLTCSPLNDGMTDDGLAINSNRS